MPHPADLSLCLFGVESKLPFQYSNLIFVFPPLAKAVYDNFYSEAQHFPVIKVQTSAYAVVMCLMLAYIDWQFSPVDYFCQSLLLQVAVFWFWFGYLQDVFKSRFKLKALNSLKQAPAKLLLLTAAVLIYYFLGIS